MDTARHFRRAGDNLEYFGPRANFVRILHDDGSMALYAHLDYGGVSVRDGQRVKRGQRIGRSGNTGFSTGPHLHFVVQVNRSRSEEHSLNSSHVAISYAVFCLKKKKQTDTIRGKHVT